MIIKFNDKVLKVGNKWISNGFPVLNGNYLVSSSVNAVSAIPSGYVNYYYYVPILENMGEHVALPNTYVANAQSISYNPKAPISIVNDNGPDNVKNLTLNFKSSDEGGISIGDNTFNNVENISINYSHNNTWLYVGNNSLNLKTEQSIVMRQDIVWKFGDNSCANLNLTCGNNGMYIFGNNSFKTITLLSGGRYNFSSGNFGADTSVTPILVPQYNQIHVWGDLISMIEATVTARGRRPWYTYPDSVPSVFAIKYTSSNIQFYCYDMTPDQCRFLYNNQRSFINPYPGETNTPIVQFLSAT